MKIAPMVTVLCAVILTCPFDAHAGGSANPSCANSDKVVRFDFTGAQQSFVVPANAISALYIEANGAQGGSGQLGGNGSVGGEGGRGGFVSGNRAASSGTTLNIFIGGQGTTTLGGFNGGADGGNSNAGGGGGATDIRVGGVAPG
ncbi:glycine-rich protein, partial [Dokdonella sp.]|uniref:glycine-rich protein n=2 Tax=Dokdonella sp. TaxID=2291710 RepID=UPI003BAE1B83